MPSGDRLDEAVDALAVASSDLLAKRALLRRVDSKFLLRAAEAAELIESLATDYVVLRAGSSSLATYRTLYFDTSDHRCFHDHRRGRRPRFKVRVRHYDDRALSYLEVKTKRGPALTRKVRMAKRYGENTLGTKERLFLSQQTPLCGSEYSPVLWTNFRRITLLGIHSLERVTIDFELEFVAGASSGSMKELAITEVKQPRYSGHTPIMRELRRRHIRPASASKYCTGMQLTQLGIRNNRFMPSLRTMKRLRS